jgi:hypothetical protein
MLAMLMTHVIYGRAHFAIVKGLISANKAVLGAAPVFFALTRDAHADLTVMTAARIFDRQRGAVSIHALLSSALKQAGTSKYGTASEVRKAVEEANVCVKKLEAILAAITTRRNQTMAHTDPSAILDSEGYLHDGLVSYRQIDGLFNETELILNRFSRLFRGDSIRLYFSDADDYKHALNLIADAQKTAR